ncbi:hypothetical protein ACFE04_012784 [Oxalis oulophora]
MESVADTEKDSVRSKSITIDRLSDLPEGILMYILRLMEMKDAICTSILSKQWYQAHLWSQLPSLYLDADSFDDLDAFQYFLFGLFTHYDKSKLYSIRYFNNELDDVDNRLLETIVDYAASNDVELLWLKCPEVFYFRLPPRLQACRFLTQLTLEQIRFNFPGPFVSRSMKSIYLDVATIDNDIVLVCENLEKFFMMECAICDTRKIVIDAPKLVILDIQYERLDDFKEEMFVSISAPRLESLAFHFNCDSLLNVSVGRCPNLESTTISFYESLKIENIEEVQRPKYAHHLVKLLKEVRDAKSLTLSSGVIKVLSLITEQLKSVPSPFHNLEYLHVYKEFMKDYIMIPPEVENYLVKGSPNASELSKGLESVKEMPK